MWYSSFPANMRSRNVHGVVTAQPAVVPVVLQPRRPRAQLIAGRRQRCCVDDPAPGPGPAAVHRRVGQFVACAFRDCRAAAQMPSTDAWFTIAVALCVGSAATLVPKVLLSLPCALVCGGAAQLNAPVFSGIVVFAASALGLGIEAASRLVSTEDAKQRSSAVSVPAWRRYSALLVPGVFNVAGTLMQLGALLFIPAAVLAGLRGAFILFTALLSRVLSLKDAPTTRTEWVCVLSAAVGAVAVGAAAALQASLAPWAEGSASGAEGGTSTLPSGATAVVVGLGLSVLGYLVAAVQVSYEAVALDGDRLEAEGRGPAFTRWEVLGVEGVFGVAVVGAALGGIQASTEAGAPPPLLDLPSHTLCCLRHSPDMVALSVAYGASSLTFNALLLLLSTSVGPNFRVFVFTARGLLTWTVEVCLFYSAASSLQPYGRGSPSTACSKRWGTSCWWEVGCTERRCKLRRRRKCRRHRGRGGEWGGEGRTRPSCSSLERAQTTRS